MEAKNSMRALMQNYNTLKATMKWTDKRILYLMAKAFIGREERLDEGDLKHVRQVLSSEAGFFSHLTSVVRDTIASLMLANDKASDKDVSLLISSYQEMKEIGFKGSSYTYFGAYLLQYSEQSRKAEDMFRGLEIFGEIKNLHPFITAAEDYSLAISLAQNEALTTASAAEIAQMVEFYYQGYRKIGLYDRNQVQFAACATVLLLGKQSSRFILGVEEMIEELKTYQIKPRPLQYTSIMMLTYLRREAGVEDISEIRDYLIEGKEQLKLFLDSQYRETMALNLFIENQSKDLSIDVTNALVVNLNQIIMQEQVIAAAAASSAVAVAASSNS